MRETIDAFGRKWKRVWVEDECLRHDPEALHVDTAWTKFFGGKYPGTKTALKADWGDTFGYLVSGKLVVRSFDGDSLWEPVESTP